MNVTEKILEQGKGLVRAIEALEVADATGLWNGEQGRDQEVEVN